jgi:Flp pilus assembly protein TadD
LTPKRLGAVVLLVLMIAAGGFAVWKLRAPAPVPPEPPLPQGLEDPEVIAAVQSARKAVTEAPNSAKAWGALGIVLLAQEFDREADECFAQAVSLDPAEPKWLYARGVIAVKKNPENALGYLRRAREIPGAREVFTSAATLKLAEDLLERGQLDEAEALFQAEADRPGRNPRAVFGLGMIAAARGNDPVATRLLKEVSGLPHARKKASARLAALARSRGDVPAATAYERAVAAFPEDLTWPDPFIEEVLARKVGRRSRYKEADRLEQTGQFADAAAMYLRQLESEPSARAYLGAGMNLARVGNFDRALPLLRKAVEQAPDDASTHYALALMLFTRSELEWQRRPGAEALKEGFREASRSARRATELKPDHAQAYLFWGLSQKYLGETAAAVETLRKGVACRPEEFELQLALGDALREVGAGAEARKHLENAARLDPNDPRPAKALELLTAPKK